MDCIATAIKLPSLVNNSESCVWVQSPGCHSTHHDRTSRPRHGPSGISPGERSGPHPKPGEVNIPHLGYEGKRYWDKRYQAILEGNPHFRQLTGFMDLINDLYQVREAIQAQELADFARSRDMMLTQQQRTAAAMAP